jgi:hypothetical protein
MNSPRRCGVPLGGGLSHLEGVWGLPGNQWEWLKTLVFGENAIIPTGEPDAA